MNWIDWIKSLFIPKMFDNHKYQLLLAKSSIEEANNTGLRWKRKRLSSKQLKNGWGHLEALGDKIIYPLYTQYYCKKCNGELIPGGPTGGGTNQVCECCKINYGCLPGALER